MGLHSSGRAAGGLITVAAVTVGLAASLGAGYTVADAALSDSSANVAKGTAVAHVNGESRRVDALSKGALARRGEDIDITTLPSGQVLVVNRKTNTVTTLDGSTMTPSGRPIRPAAAGQVTRPSAIVVAGSGGWVIDFDGSGVRRIVDGTPQDLVKLPSTPTDAAPAQNGGVVVVTKAGTLLRVDLSEKVHRIETDPAKGAGLTRAGGKTYLVRTSGEVDLIDGDSVTKVGEVSGVAVGAQGRMVVGALQSTGDHVLIVSSDVLSWLDPESGKPSALALHSGSATSLGQPVEFQGKAYIPDYSSKHRVLVVDLRTKQQGKPIKVPGTEKEFALFVSGGKLWANDQYAQHLLVFDKDGERHQVDKGAGNGTKDDTKKPRTPTGPTGGGAPAGTPTGGSGGSGGGNNPGNGGNGGSGNGSGSGGGSGNDKPKLVTVPTFPPGTDYNDACDKIQELGPSCNPVSRADDTRDSDEVLETHPGAGKKVPEDSEITVVYVGPTAVPAIPDQSTPDQACGLIEAVKLTCKLAPSPKPAANPSYFGAVRETNPPADTEVKNGAEITVYYYDSFTMPQYSNNGTAGTVACGAINGKQLQGEGIQPASIQCNANAGNPVPKGQPDLLGKVYHQNVEAGQVYKPGGGSQPIVLDIYGDQADLKDYRRNGQNANDAANDCNTVFNCSVSDQTVPAVVDGQARPDLVGQVARMDDENGEIQPGRYTVGQKTVKMVAYRGDADVPPVTGQDFNTACQNIQNAGGGFKCNPVVKPAKNVPPNQVTEQSKTGTQPVGTTVDVFYFPGAPVPIHMWVHPDGRGGVYYLTTGAQPNVADIQDRGVIAYGWATGSTGVNNWGLYQQNGNNCSSSHPGPNVIYTHGQIQLPGCNGGWQQAGTVADLFYPGQDASGQIDPNTCGYGMVWLYRNATRNSQGDYVHSYETRGPTKSGDADDESIGCVYAP